MSTLGHLAHKLAGSSLRSVSCGTHSFPSLPVPVRCFHATLPSQERLVWFAHRPANNAIFRNFIPPPLNTGDREEIPKIDIKRLRPAFQHCHDQLERAHPDVRRLCSMEYATEYDRQCQLEQDLTKRVQKYASDSRSLEVTIARLTAKIRVENARTRAMSRGPAGYKRGPHNISLVKAIDQRKKYLGDLRDGDYNKFTWILEQLNLDYGNPTDKVRNTRRNIEVGLAVKAAMTIRRDKFVQYHEKLKAQQGPFLARQEKELGELAEEEKMLLAKLETLGDPAVSNVVNVVKV